jgi:hypothetical protein
MKMCHEEEMRSLQRKREAIQNALKCRQKAEAAMAGEGIEQVYLSYTPRPVPKDRTIGTNGRCAGGWGNPLL